MNDKICNCEYCKLSNRITALQLKLPPELAEEYKDITNILWEGMESAELDLNVLNAKIQGTWPRDDGEKYYHCTGGKKYEITSSPIEAINK